MTAPVTPAAPALPVVAPTKGTSVVSDLLDATKVRSDIVTVLGVLGVVAAAFGKNLHIPAVPDVVLMAVSALVGIVAVTVQTVVHGGVTKVALQNDAVFLKEEWPKLKADLEVLKPFAEQVPQLKSAIDAASADAAKATSVASQVQAQLASLPADQKSAVEDALRGLLASVVPATVAPAAVAEVVAPAPAV